MNEMLIGEFVKNASETIRVSLVTCGLCRSVDVRVWSTPRPGDAPGLHPTKEGLTVGADLLPDLIALLERARTGGGNLG